MFDDARFEMYLEQYKQQFPANHWIDEKYKWAAVQHFQQHWNIAADDFAEMLSQSLAKTENLLAAAMFYPASTIVEFARVLPEDVRAMFSDLFDESQDVIERIDAFKTQSKELARRLLPDGKQDFQTDNTITTYLWLRYPDRYAIYKYSICRSIVERLQIDLPVKQGHYTSNLRHFKLIYDELSERLKRDDGVRQMIQPLLAADSSLYPDPEFKTAAIDFGYFISTLEDAQDNAQAKPKPNDDTSSDERETADATLPLDPAQAPSQPSPYTRDDFLAEVYMSETRYDTLVSVLKNKKNVILQGAPGVGKTFAARRLAYSIMGARDDRRVAFIQFHQNYAYEDFVMGYKPVEDGFALQDGIFYRFCKQAEAEPERDFFFIIDEINRGNLSKIFGELLMLIERDYRGTPALLAYSGQKFTVPENLFIIGMMNTADRSLALIDYALRRRFSFFELEPGFASEGFMAYQASLGHETFDTLIEIIEALNREIAHDASLGRGFRIGHSYFCGQTASSDNWLQEIVEFDIIPMLEEYWFDDEAKRQHWASTLRSVFQ